MNNKKNILEKKWTPIVGLLLLLIGMLLVVLAGRLPGNVHEEMSGSEYSSDDGEEFATDVIFLEDYRHYNKIAWDKGKNMSRLGDFKVQLDYIFCGDVPDIQFVSFDHETANECLISMTEAAEDLEFQNTYKGYRLGCKVFAFDLSSLDSGDTLEINEINLMVNGKKRKIHTEGNIICHFLSQEDEDYTSDALELTGSGSNSFEVKLKEDVVFDRLEFQDFVTIPEARLSLNGESHSVNEAFPLKADKGEAVFTVRSLDFGTHGARYGGMAKFDTDILLYYQSKKSGQKILPVSMEVSPKLHEPTCEELINQVLVMTGLADNEIFFTKDSLYVDYTNGASDSQIMVDISVLCKDCDPYLEWRGFGDPIADLLMRGSEQGSEFPDIICEGWRLKCLTMTLDTSKLPSDWQTVDIHSIILSVGGKEVTLDTSGRFLLKQDPEAKTLNGYGGIRFFGGRPRTGLLEDDQYESTRDYYEIMEDCVLEKFTLGDGLFEIADSGVTTGYVSVDQEELGSLEEVLPLTLKKGQVLQIKFTPKLGTADPYVAYCINENLYYSNSQGSFVDRNYIQLLPYATHQMVNDTRPFEEYLKHLYRTYISPE